MKIIHVDYKHHDYHCFRKSMAVCGLEDYERMVAFDSFRERIQFRDGWWSVLWTKAAGTGYAWVFPGRHTLVARASFHDNWRKALWPKDELGNPVDYCVLASSVRFTNNY